MANNNGLAIAELAIYALLAVPTIYLIISHAPTGALGWFYLFAFTSLRVVDGVMSVNPTSSASIISNVGLSPLLLATGGILHEARKYRKVNNSRLEWTLVAFFHVLVTTGVALVGSGASALQSANPTENDLVLAKVGMALLTVAWFVLCIWTVVSYLPGQSSPTTQLHVFGTKLLLSIVLSLPFIGIRVFYTLVALTTRKAYLSPVNGILAIRVLLSFLPELIATLIFVTFGFLTRRGAALARKQMREKKRTHQSGSTSRWNSVS